MRLLFIFFLIPVLAFGQPKKEPSIVEFQKSIKVKDSVQAALYLQGRDSLATKKEMRNNTTTLSYNGRRTVTTTAWPYNVKPGGLTVTAFLDSVFYQSLPPTSTISTSPVNREFMASGANLTVSLSWSATRPVACLPITSISVNSVSQTLNSPFAEGHTQSGTLPGQTLVRNTNTTYSIVVNSTDKSSTSSVVVNWYWSRYFGVFSTSATPTTGDNSFISEAEILALTPELSTSCAKNFGSISCSNQYYIYAVPHSWCSSVSFTLNTFPTDFIKVWDNLSFTNVSGGVTNMDVYISPNKYNGTITVTAN